MGQNYRLVFRVHVIQRMFERNISDEDIRSVIEKGETIKEYSDDKPFPSRLMLGKIGTRPLHVVVAENHEAQETIVITAYEPDEKIWEVDFRSRKRQ
jgi:hypothetical protein